MLVEFSIENFLSFKDRVTFSMLASSDDSNPDNMFNCKTLTGDTKNLLKSSAIYGANASGKSNFIIAIDFIKSLVLTSHKNQEGDLININQFKLDKNCESKPTSFEIIFIYENVKYCYGVKLDKEKIHEEYLYHWPNGRRAMVFERQGTDKFVFQKESKTKKEELKQEIYLESTLDNTLFISQATKLKHPTMTQAFKWFREKLRLLFDYEDLEGFTLKSIEESSKFKDKVLKYLEFADIGIKDLKVTKKYVNFDKMPQLSNLVGVATEDVNFDEMPLLKEYLLKSKSLSEKETTDIDLNEIKLFGADMISYHKGIDVNGNNTLIPFNIADESAGTQKYIHLIGPIIDSLENGYTVFIDELDLHLHPNILKELVKIMHNPEVNKNNAQFIFTTHCTNLLDLELFRRDQIWFTDKNNETGITDLISLADYSPRKDLNIQKGYLEGRFGAVPFLNEGILLCPPEEKI